MPVAEEVDESQPQGWSFADEPAKSASGWSFADEPAKPKLTGAQTGLPGIAKPPLPLALQPPVTSIQSDTPTYQNPRTGVRYARQQPGVEGGLAGIVDAPLTGGAEVGAGVAQLAEPVEKLNFP